VGYVDDMLLNSREVPDLVANLKETLDTRGRLKSLIGLSRKVSRPDLGKLKGALTRGSHSR